MKSVALCVLKFLIIFYQKFVSPLFIPSCRYIPTCSQYALNAINKFGVLKGGKLTIKRILTCHPWGGQGHDPIP